MCRITIAGGPHPASPRRPKQRLCDLHAKDFQRAKNRWKQAIKRHREPDDPAYPGSWDEFEREVTWTRIDRVFVLTDPDIREQLREIADDLAKARSWMDGWAKSPRLWNRLSWDGFRSQSITYDEYLNSAVTALRRLGEEPE